MIKETRVTSKYKVSLDTEELSGTGGNLYSNSDIVMEGDQTLDGLIGNGHQTIWQMIKWFIDFMREFRKMINCSVDAH